MAKKSAQSAEERDEFLAKIKADFDERLARIAADPVQWVEFIERVAAFGARYSLSNQMLLLMQAEERGVEPQFFLPYGNKTKATGWLKEQRQVLEGETSYKILAPVTRRPTEKEAQESEAAGRKVKRDANDRPVVQVVGFRLMSTFDPLSRDYSLRRDAPVVSLQVIPFQATRNSDRDVWNVVAR